jgi:hypothetical protein
LDEFGFEVGLRVVGFDDVGFCVGPVGFDIGSLGVAPASLGSWHHSVIQGL